MTTTATRRPLACNTGANLPEQTLRWDWYQATIRGAFDVTRVLVRLAQEVVGSSWRPVRALYGYVEGWKLDGLPEGSLQLFSRENGAELHLQATGAAAERFVPLIRRTWPEHAVSRADVALDVDYAGSFEKLYRRVHELALQPSARGGRRVGTSVAGDWLEGQRGRTFYAGGASSRGRVVVYEKGHEQLQRDPECGASVDWTRVEWRLRPDTDQKTWLATASPAEALGLTTFGALVARELLDEEVLALGSALRFASQDPAYWMAKQYRRTLQQLLELPPEQLRPRLVELVEAVNSRA